MAETTASASSGASPSLSDSELLALLQRERQSAVGFEKDQTLLDDREKALNYTKGEMPDVPSLENRSKAVSSDVSDAIETALPDLVEIFTGGDDVLAFTPTNAEDEDAAEQETDYLRHVIMQENDGFMLLYTLFKDALQQKIGVASWWWEEKTKVTETKFEGKNAVEMALAAQDGELKDVVQDEMDPDYSASAEPSEDGEPQAMPPEQTYSFTLVSSKDQSRIRIVAVPPDDFTVAQDTVRLGPDTTYCAMRARPRAQDLLADGVPQDIIDQLPPYTEKTDTQIELARDTAGEHSDPGETDQGNMRQVEVISHFVRLLGTNDEMETWRVRTGKEEGVLIDKEKVSGLNFAAITPYPVTHRFYGRSLADLLLELQRINTAITRAALDSLYFALNQRMVVADEGKNEFTISDLLRPEPGLPIRVKSAGAVTAANSAGLAFNPYEALEYFATVGERRTGIVRNAQGLNPDTLHDTAGGAFALMAASAKRLRLVARIFAETGIRDLYLGVHATIRENCTSQRIARLQGKWIPVDPTKWAERNDMTIEVGLGASGKDHDIAMANQMTAIMDKIVQGQGGSASGPIVTPENVYNLASDIFAKLGAKKASRYLTDPATAPAPAAPPPNPEMVKVQGELQLKQQDQQASQAADAAKTQAQMAQDRELNTLEAQRDALKHQADMELEKVKIESNERIAIAVARINAQGRIAAASASKTGDGTAAFVYEQQNEDAINGG